MATTLVAMSSVRHDYKIKWHVEPTNGCGDCKWRVQCLQKCCDKWRTAKHDSTSSSFRLEWAKQDTTPADNALELMVFDPTKTREKSTVLHQLTDGNRFVSNANLLQLVMFMSFENEYVKCFGTKYRANKFVRASTACVTTSPITSDGMSFAWIINWNWELIFFDANGNTGGNLLVSLRNLHAVSSSGELYTLSRCENEFKLFDRPCHSWMREQSGWTTYQIEEEEMSLTNPNRWV